MWQGVRTFEEVDFKIAMSFQVSSYNENRSSSDTHEGSIENSGILELQLYQFEPPVHKIDEEVGGDMRLR